jgi:hypothetical protein
MVRNPDYNYRCKKYAVPARSLEDFFRANLKPSLGFMLYGDFMSETQQALQEKGYFFLAGAFTKTGEPCAYYPEHEYPW